MALRRFRGCGVHALPALLLLLLLPPPATPGTTCPTPPSVAHADIQVKSYRENSRERYVCNSGFKRKAGTSTLTECLFNKITNTTQWTTPNLKCIRNPSLAHQRPVSPSTVVMPEATPQPDSPSPSGTEPAVLSPRSDITPGSPLSSSHLPSAGAAETGGRGSSQAPSPTTAKTASTPLGTPGVHPYMSKTTTVAVSTCTSGVLAVCVVVLLAWYFRSRNSSHRPGPEMDTTEAMPMAVRIGSTGQDTESHPHDL